jgi:hypothetical protein
MNCFDFGFVDCLNDAPTIVFTGNARQDFEQSIVIFCACVMCFVLHNAHLFYHNLCTALVYRRCS